MCLCILPYRHTGFTCGYVCISVYSHRVHFVFIYLESQVGVCMFPYTYTEFTRGHVCISVYSHRVHFVSCVYSHRGHMWV